jgi:hypothetical protein
VKMSYRRFSEPAYLSAKVVYLISILTVSMNKFRLHLTGSYERKADTDFFASIVSKREFLTFPRLKQIFCFECHS